MKKPTEPDAGRRMLSLRIPQSMIDALDKWCAQQRVPPDRTSVIEAAIREFLEREGGGAGKAGKGGR